MTLFDGANCQVPTQEHGTKHCRVETTLPIGTIQNCGQVAETGSSCGTHSFICLKHGV